MTIDDVLAYPSRYRVHRYASVAVSSQCTLLAAEIFADEYKAEMGVLPKEDKPPCCCCPDACVYFCYLTEMECRKYVLWVDEVR